ncbi:MAG: hypothetical protein WD071_16920 [Pseudohongiella sp.]|uniref:hypothetical protein n=1 Tax=Pseudohongiella sp. TaxID=1979412 RepID=UPI0034A05340
MLLANCAIGNPEPRVLVLPEDQDKLDSLMITGTREYPQLQGLSRIVVGGSGESYYIVDTQLTSQRYILDSLSRMPRETTISIKQDHWNGLFWNVANLQLGGGGRDTVHYRYFDPSLPIQLDQQQTQNGSAQQQSVYLTEHRFNVDDCAELRDAINTLQSTLISAVANIGHVPPPAPGEVEEVIVGGGGYELQVRMQDLVASYSVGPNSRQAHEATRQVAQAIGRCAREHPGEQRPVNIWGGSPVSEIIFTRDD